MNKFSQLLENINNKNAFLLGSIYRWVMIDKKEKVILAYSSYNKGTRSSEILTKDIDTYYEEHKKKLRLYLKDSFDVDLNKNIKSKYSFEKTINNGVSVILDFDIEIPDNVECKETYICGKIEKKILLASEEEKKHFIIGLMDFCGSLDFTLGYITVDIENTVNPNLIRKKIDFITSLVGLIFNYNPRYLQPEYAEEKTMRNDQFRIPMNYYMGCYGLFTPFKQEYYVREKKLDLELLNEPFLKDGDRVSARKSLDKKHQERLDINTYAQNLKLGKLTEIEKFDFIERYRNKFGNDLTEDEIKYSNPYVKKSAKEKANHKCEIDGDKESFTSKSNNKNYVEAHHLIPFHKRDNFDVNIDVIENIVCLTPKNHRKIHLAIESERNELLKKLYENRAESLRGVGIDITLEQLKSMYT